MVNFIQKRLRVSQLLKDTKASIINIREVIDYENK